MIFNRRVTLYLNDAAVQLEDVGDLARAMDADYWIAYEETGQYEMGCNCGSHSCRNVAFESGEQA